MPSKIQIIKEKIRWWHKVAFMAVLFLSLLAAKTAFAATMYFSPSDKTCSVGQSCAISVFVSSPDQAMNAASGVALFPADKLQISSISKSGSVFGMWVQEPSFSNSAGTVNFEGIVMNPGFTGVSGKLLTINFTAKAPGTADVTFSSGDVLANDGQGTNILKNLSGARINIQVPITSPPASQATTPASAPGTPYAPQITSSTHPDADAWYSNNNPAFAWEIPKGVTAVRALYDDSPGSIPAVVYSPPITEKVLKNVPDGVWYFHLQFKNQNGWGTVAHRKFQIDTTPPQSFKIKIIDGPEINNPRPTILFNTVDGVSGMDYYSVKIGEGDFTTISTDQVKSNPYTLPPQMPGKRTILVKAVDKAGNYVTDVAEVIIKAIAAPIVTSYPKELLPGENLIVKGTALPQARLSLWLLRSDVDGQPVKYRVYPEADSSFTYIVPDKLQSGVYYFWLTALTDNDASSEPTEKFTVIVGPTFFSRLISRLTGWLTLVVPAVIMLAFLALALWYWWYKFRALKRKLRKDTGSAGTALHQSFKVLREEILGHLRLLEKAKTKRELTEEESKIVKQFKSSLDGTEGFIGEEIEQIERDAK